MIKNINLVKIGKVVTYLILFINILIKLLISINIVPSSFNYLLDILIIILTFVIFCYFIQNNREIKHLNFFLIPCCMFFIVGIFSVVVSKTPMLLYIWHLRNYYRLFIFFIACVLFFSNNDIHTIFKIGFYILIIHAILTTIQLITLYIQNGQFWYQDYINGIFGKVKGLNTYSIILIVSILCYYTYSFLVRKTTIKKFFLIHLLGGWIAAIAEFKIYYVLIIILIALVIFLFIVGVYRDRLRTIFLIFAISIFISFMSMQFFYPQFKNFFFNFNQFKNYTTDVSYGSEEETKITVPVTPDTNQNNETQENSDPTNDVQDITIPGVNRISAFKIIPEHFFKSSHQYFIGIGAGNAEYSKNDILCSEFYHTYGNINYNKFTSSFLLLETGYLGLIFYSLIYVSILLYSIIYIFKTRGRFKHSGTILITIFASLLCLLMMVYDSALRTEASYFYGFLLSVGIIFIKNNEINLRYGKY